MYSVIVINCEYNYTAMYLLLCWCRQMVITSLAI